MYPAIAIADAVKRRAAGAVVAFAGTRERMEWEAVPKAGYAIHPITVQGLPRQVSPKLATFPVALMQGLVDSVKLVGGFDPDVVVGTGGYVTGPVLLAAALRGRPTVLQEQNAHAGLTNRLLGRFAKRIHVAFPEVEGQLPAEKCRMSGNPVRAELAEADREEARAHFELPEDAIFLCVFGGSLGSGALNNAVEQHLGTLLADERVHLFWQCGKAYHEALAERVPEHPRVKLQAYVDRMDLAYAACDLALCRAGAITCSELMVTATPAVLVPSPNVTVDHQTRNAESLSKRDAAVLLPEPQLAERLPSVIQALLADDARRAKMAQHAHNLARPDAADRIADDVLALAGLPATA